MADLPASPKLSVIIPCYNERATIREILNRVRAVPLELDILVVDDGSTDGTREILSECEENGGVRVIYHPENRGKGAALTTGFTAARGDVFVIQDADLEYDPSDFVRLFRPIRDGVADVVYGSRFGGGLTKVQMFWHRAGNKFLTFLTGILYNTTLTDMETCYKMFRREVAEGITLRSRGFEESAEFTAKVLKNKKWRIYEVSISYFGRAYAEGKKITWRDGFVAIWTLLRYRFVD